MQKFNKLSALMNKQMKPSGIIRLWGRFRFLWNFAAVYVSIWVLIFSAITAYATTLAPWLRDIIGINIPFYAFVAVIVVSLIIALIIEHKVTVPGQIAVTNEQIYKQDNPLVRDIADLKKDTVGLKKDIAALRKEIAGWRASNEINK
ncbi:unnamed protein product [marine sediment metagenome]|uniref:Uncharacterized protein n=1 Tax=marine sediment metagenome TaxID=412755 RepID=X1FMI6_9ZZZZ